MRSGRLADHHLDDLPIAQRAAGGERVGDVVLEAVLRIEHAGDAALGVVAVRLQQAVLGDHQHGQRRIDRHRRPQARQPAADDQHVGEMVRHPLGVKRNEIAGDVQHEPIMGESSYVVITVGCDWLALHCETASGYPNGWTAACSFAAAPLIRQRHRVG